MRRSPAVIGALLALVLAGVVLTAAHTSPRLRLAPRVALADVLRDVRTMDALRGVHWTRTTVSAIDGRLERVSFYQGAQILSEVAVGPHGAVDQVFGFRGQAVPYGDWLAYQPAILIGLAALFALMAGVAPLRRLRNLDVLAAISLLPSVVLLQHRYLGASVLAAGPGLGYLMLRCAWLALGPARPPSVRCTPLFDHLTAGLQPGERVRVLRLTLIALALVIAMVGVSSTDAVDVIYAVMEGATKLIHGVLPYGHLPGDVLHGDTYPILSYALYAPLAWLAPVGSNWDSVDGALAVAALAAIASAGAVLLATTGRRGWWRGRTEIDPVLEAAGLRAALTCLSFPLVMITVSTGTTDVVLATMVCIAVVLWRRPTASCAWLAAAGWFKLAPFALLPIWLAPLRGKRLLGALGAITGVSVAMVALLVGLGGVHGPAAMIHALSFQFSRGSPQSLWSVLGVEGLQPIAQAAVLALIAGATVRLWREPELAADRTRVAALATSILLGLQLSADYWAFLYVVWIVPLLGLSLLAERVPASFAEPVPATPGMPGLLPVPSG